MKRIDKSWPEIKAIEEASVHKSGIKKIINKIESFQSPDEVITYVEDLRNALLEKNIIQNKTEEIIKKDGKSELVEIDQTQPFNYRFNSGLDAYIYFSKDVSDEISRVMNSVIHAAAEEKLNRKQKDEVKSFPI